MRGDLLDLLLLGLVVLFAISGYRQGFIIGVLSFVGFIGGGVLGTLVAPSIARAIVDGAAQQALLAIVIVFLAATAGQLLSSSVGAVIRDRVTWNSAQIVDAVGGSVVSVLSLLLVAWLIGMAIVNSPFGPLRSQVNRSAVLNAVDGIMPEASADWFSSFRRFVDRTEFPQVFGGLGGESTVNVPPPDNSVLDTPDLRRSRRSVVKITVTAPSCQRRTEGTGFVYAPQRVMTNAHVLSGVRGRPTVHVGGDEYRARVVVYNPKRDIAVLYVPDLQRTTLEFDSTAETRDDAVVVGYPRGQPFTAVAARVRAKQRARGPDIYHSSQVTREIYTIRGSVEPGNSGGPLLSPDGEVYGVVFAAAVDNDGTGYVLTADEVEPDTRRGRTATESVSTQGCD